MPTALLAMQGTHLVRRSYDPNIDDKGIRSFDSEAAQPNLAVFNAVLCRFVGYAHTSAQASSLVFKELKKLQRREAELRQLAEEGAVGYTHRSVAAMLVQAISTVKARLEAAEGITSVAAASATTQQDRASGKSCFVVSRFLQSRQVQAAPAGPTAYSVLAGNPMSLFGTLAGIPHGKCMGYTPPKPAAQCISIAPAACTAGPSSSSQGVGSSSPASVSAGGDSRPSAAGKGQEAAVVGALDVAEGQACAGKGTQARSSGGSSSTGMDYLKAPRAHRNLHRCGTTRVQPLQANSSTAGGQGSGGVSSMRSTPASPMGSSSGGRRSRGSRASIGSLDSSSVDCRSLQRSSSCGSSSLGGCSSVQRSSSCGSLPGASLELPVIPALPAASNNMCGAGDKGSSSSWGMGRVCVLVLVLLLVMLLVMLLVLAAFVMQQCLASVCQSADSSNNSCCSCSDAGSGSSGSTIAVLS